MNEHYFVILRKTKPKNYFSFLSFDSDVCKDISDAPSLLEQNAMTWEITLNNIVAQMAMSYASIK